MGDSTQPTQQQILDALARIIRSDSVGKASRLSALLRYVVTEELAGRGGDLKGYSIGLDVLQRDSDFDPNTDSIVRVEFRRLRQALELLLSDRRQGRAGQNSPAQWDLPAKIWSRRREPVHIPPSRGYVNGAG